MSLQTLWKMDPIRVTGEKYVFIRHLCFSLMAFSVYTAVDLIIIFLFLLKSSAAHRKGPSKDDTYWKEINAAMALTNLAQGKDTLQGTTSCIIQKSSHIAEVKTVKVPLVHQF